MMHTSDFSSIYKIKGFINSQEIYFIGNSQDIQLKFTADINNSWSTTDIDKAKSVLKQLLIIAPEYKWQLL